MKYIKKYYKQIIFYSLLIAIGLATIIFSFNNYRYYKEPILKITSTKEEYLETIELNYGYHEDIYSQTIIGTIKNGEDKGKEVTILNEYYEGEAYSQKYHKNDELFISLNKREGKIISAHIEGYKRDKYIVLIVVIFVITIISVGKLKGFLSIISVIANVFLFNIIIYLNTKDINLALLSYFGSIIFCIICLTLVCGFNKKTLASLLSSIVGITVTLLISLIVIHITKYKGIRFEEMELLTRPYEGIFLSEIIMGGIGAIMDISITISSSLNELIEKNKHIKLTSLINSGINIGSDVTGTMINVLFFTYISGAIPNLVIYFRNGIKINALLNEYISLEMTRALTGAIGIIVTIPISIAITILLYKRRLKS